MQGCHICGECGDTDVGDEAGQRDAAEGAGRGAGVRRSDTDAGAGTAEIGAAGCEAENIVR